MSNKTLRIEKGRTKLIVPHNGKNVIFVHPAIGPDNYSIVGKSILNRDSSIPTGGHILSLIYGAFNKETQFDPEFGEVRDILKNNFYWIFSNNLWVPGKGVYVKQDPSAKGAAKQMKLSKLEKELKGGKEIERVTFSKDGSLRFAPMDCFRLGNHTKESLVKDGFVIATFGYKGARILGELSRIFECPPYTQGVKDNDNPVQTVSALIADCGARRISVSGSSIGDSTRGYSFGMFKP